MLSFATSNRRAVANLTTMLPVAAPLQMTGVATDEATVTITTTMIWWRTATVTTITNAVAVTTMVTMETIATLAIVIAVDAWRTLLLPYPTCIYPYTTPNIPDYPHALCVYVLLFAAQCLLISLSPPLAVPCGTCL